jgi:hypothetical protein
MALHFVSTSVLTSDNGIDFSNETAIETVEAKTLKLKLKWETMQCRQAKILLKH